MSKARCPHCRREIEIDVVVTLAGTATTCPQIQTKALEPPTTKYSINRAGIRSSAESAEDGYKGD